MELKSWVMFEWYIGDIGQYVFRTLMRESKELEFTSKLTHLFVKE